MTLLISLVANATAVTAPSTTPTVDPQQAARDEIIVTGQRTEGKDDYTIDGQTTATRIPRPCARRRSRSASSPGSRSPISS